MLGRVSGNERALVWAVEQLGSPIAEARPADWWVDVHDAGADHGGR